MNCHLYCILSYEQVYSVKHCDTCQCSALLWLLPARAHTFPFDSAHGDGEGVSTCVWERLPLREKMSSPKGMSPILSVLNIFGEHLPLCVFSSALFLPCLFLHLGGNISLYSLLPTPILLIWREVQKKQRCKKLLQELEATLVGELHLSSAIWWLRFSCYLPYKSFGPLDQFPSCLSHHTTVAGCEMKRWGNMQVYPAENKGVLTTSI